MVVAGKIFRLNEPFPISDIAAKLDGYRTEEKFEENNFNFPIVTEVTGLLPKGKTVTGVYSHDYIMHVFHRGETTPLPRTVEAMFSFAEVGKEVFLTVVEKKRVANYIANELSKVLFDKVGRVLEAKIPPETLREFHLRNREDTKITFFDNVDIPNVDKLSLYGPDLINTSLFDEYTKHGDLWYVVARSKETGYVVGVTRDSSVTIFNSADKLKYIEYINKEIYPIIPKGKA